MGEGARSRPNKSLKHSQIEVVTQWQHMKEISPAFWHLMTLLLRERIENGKRTGTESAGPDHQML